MVVFVIQIILLLLIIIYTLNLYKIKYKLSVIIKANRKNKKAMKNKLVEKYVFVSNTKYKINLNYLNYSAANLLLEHNMKNDDILFLIPLYNIIIKTEFVAICNRNFHAFYRKRTYNYFTHKGCIFFNINYLKLLHIHTNIFRNCKFINIYNLFKKGIINMKYIKKFCRMEEFSFNYSVVTTLYRRNYLKKQIQYLINQSLPPKNIIVVHDRNYLKFDINCSNLIYIHTINFKAGFYFRYLLASLSPADDVMIYDDDYLPANKNLHLIWLKNINNSRRGIYCHRIGVLKNLKWCATPLIVKRKLLYLQWINRIYEPSQAEDGHLSFSILLLCNISCNLMRIIGILHLKDNLSSPRKKLNPGFWNGYIKFIKCEINSSYIQDMKQKFYIS